MKKNSYNANDICIVGLGCVLPDANNRQEFWNNILKGNCSIKKMPEKRWKSGLYFSLDRKEEDKTYSNVAAFVENSQLEKLCKKLGLQFSKNTRLQIMALEAATQALGCLSPNTLDKTKKRAAIFLGCMEIDEAFTLEKFYLQNKKSLEDYISRNDLKNKEEILAEIKKYFNKNGWDEKSAISSVLTTSVIDLIKQRFGIQGEGALIDAACASSLAAIDVAARALRNHKTDLAVTGGIESNLAPDTFVLFSKVGALSEGKCKPFDKKADGLSQGEGSAVFVLQRLEDAIRDKNKIYGVVRSVGSSSDGKNSSLFSPSVEGQILALERAYAGLDKNSVNYIECHGTGTKLGDATELEALNKFFAGKEIPIGSVKSLIGHTKGAAGAAGLLKCILNLQNKKISPSKYIETFAISNRNSVYPNREIIELKDSQSPLRFGISSFGFGNANYHLVLDEFRTGSEIEKTADEKLADDIVILSQSSMSLEKIDFNRITAKFKIPPQSLSHIDKVQLQALLAVSGAFEKANIRIDLLDKKEVTVISASSLGLDCATDLAKRIRHFEFNDALNFLDNVSLDIMLKHKNKFPEVTEDTGPGVLNNVIAGRTCNAFDFKGENFNVDCDFNSFSAALNIATQRLQEKEGIVVLLYCEEELDKQHMCIERKRINCLILATLSLAKKNNYPIGGIIKKIDYHDSK
jgi:acyl transferase domain-containing protein